jgi:hypothetical protein
LNLGDGLGWGWGLQCNIILNGNNGKFLISLIFSRNELLLSEEKNTLPGKVFLLREDQLQIVWPRRKKSIEKTSFQ